MTALRRRPPARESESTGLGAVRVAVGAHRLRVGGGWSAVLVVVGYPRQVHAGWLSPLTTYPGRVDVSVHVDPVDPVVAAGQLRRRLALLESGRRSDADHGRLADPHVEAATEDAYGLADRIARGEARLFRVGLSITVHAYTDAELTERVGEVRALAASMLIDARPAAYRELAGWVTGLPLGMDRLAGQRVLDTDPLAAAFPFTSPDLPDQPGSGAGGGLGGVLYGHNLGSAGLVFWDRFACDNHNAVILGRSGAGKSYLVKLELLRSLYRGVEAMVIDPEDEYRRLAHAVGGTVIAPGAPEVRINPFDLPIHAAGGRWVAPRDALSRRRLFLHTVVAVLLDGALAAVERAVLDTAITATYARAGITEDPATWVRPAPLLTDLHTALTDPDTAPDRDAMRRSIRDALTGPDPAPDADLLPPPGSGPGDGTGGVSAGLAARLRPFVDGAFAGLFHGPTTTATDGPGHLVVWSLRALPEELKPVATLLCLDAIWARVSDPRMRRPRMVVVDEAWLLARQPAGAAFLLRAAKAGRKHWTGLTVATQDAADLLGTAIGKAVVANAATQILLRQAPQAIDQVTATFGLSAGERAFLLSAEQGDALLCAGAHRAAFRAAASPVEHGLITTDPAEHTAGDEPGYGELIDLGAR